MYLRNLAVMIRELFGYAWRSREWWIVPLVLLLLLVGLLLVASYGTAPFVYTIF
jgi:hypothetical protein